MKPDIKFIEFYVKTYHKSTLEEYFSITSAVASIWRRNSFPDKRLNEFLVREESFSVHELFERIYPKLN